MTVLAGPARIVLPRMIPPEVVRVSMGGPSGFEIVCPHIFPARGSRGKEIIEGMWLAPLVYHYLGGTVRQSRPELMATLGRGIADAPSGVRTLTFGPRSAILHLLVSGRDFPLPPPA